MKRAKWRKVRTHYGWEWRLRAGIVLIRVRQCLDDDPHRGICPDGDWFGDVAIWHGPSLPCPIVVYPDPARVGRHALAWVRRSFGPIVDAADDPPEEPAP